MDFTLSKEHEMARQLFPFPRSTADRAVIP